MTLSQKLRAPSGLDGSVYDGVENLVSEDAPAVRLVDDILERAVRERASDVHVDPLASGEAIVRHRVDGLLCRRSTIPQDLARRVSSRLKLLAGMDIADRRLPQDGRFQLASNRRPAEVRVSSMPTIYGERVSLRLLNVHASLPSLEELGMSAALCSRVRALISAPAGFVVVCGPTGSGKTTTLYSALSERAQAGDHACSVEDPVETEIDGVAQVQVNVRAGLTFPVALRAFLRQDPDVVMIGEMRDAETAAVACGAALCGRLVVTTLHAANAAGAVARLEDLGVPPREARASISGILSQRLVRRLCVHCREFGGTGTAVAAGCEQCGGSGYRGRIALFELESPAGGASSASDSFRSQTAALLLRGETSSDEVRRVLGTEP